MILALDPSLSCIGWAVLELDAGRVVEYGTYKPQGETLDERLADAHGWLHEWFEDDDERNYNPTAFAFEMPVVHRNMATTIKLASLS